MRKRAAATSRFVRPSATSVAIRRSASVSSSPDGVRPPIRASSARACSAQSGAPSRSKRVERVLERRAGGAALLRAPLRSSEREQRARVVERVGAAGVFGERALEARERAVEIATRRQQEPAAAREDRQRPGPVERVGALLPRLENLVGLVELADRDQRLEQVAQLQPLSRFEHEGVAKLVRASEVRQRRARPRARARRSPAPSRAPTARCGSPRPRRGRSRLRPCARLVDPARWAAIDGSGKLVRGITRPSCVRRSTESAVYRSASSQFPARHSSRPRYQSASASPAGSFRAHGGSGLPGSRFRARSTSADQHSCHPSTQSGRRRAASRTRSLERERLFHLLGRDAAAAVEVHEAVGRERAAAERRIADARSGANRELACSIPSSIPSLKRISAARRRWMVAWSESSPSAPRRPRGRGRPRLAGLAGRRRAVRRRRALDPRLQQLHALLEQRGRSAVSPARLCMSAATNSRRCASSGFAGVSVEALARRARRPSRRAAPCAVWAASSRVDATSPSGLAVARARWRARSSAEETISASRACSDRRRAGVCRRRPRSQQRMVNRRLPVELRRSCVERLCEPLSHGRAERRFD